MHLQRQNLSPEKQKLLEDLLNHHGFDILIEVLESGRFDMMAESATLRQYAPDEQGNKNAETVEGAARQILFIIKTLQSMKAQKEPFTTSTATPHE
jgi:hypothetical protein